jgi:hypothetical protein
MPEITCTTLQVFLPWLPPARDWFQVVRTSSDQISDWTSALLNGKTCTWPAEKNKLVDLYSRQESVVYFDVVV